MVLGTPKPLPSSNPQDNHSTVSAEYGHKWLFSVIYKEEKKLINWKLDTDNTY